MPDTTFILLTVEYLAYLFIFVLGLIFLTVLVIYIIDVNLMATFLAMLLSQKILCTDTHT